MFGYTQSRSFSQSYPPQEFREVAPHAGFCPSITWPPLPDWVFDNEAELGDLLAAAHRNPIPRLT